MGRPVSEHSIKTDPNYPHREGYGNPIPGSKYLRAWCNFCGEAMRVTEYSILSSDVHCCDQCMDSPPPAWTGLCSRQKAGLLKVMREET